MAVGQSHQDTIPLTREQKNETRLQKVVAGSRNKQSLDYLWRTGLAGGLAGCAAKTLVGPLDRVKILFQASNPQFAKYTGSWLGVARAVQDINRQAGLRGLFRGHSATLLRIFPYAAIKFVAYEQTRAILIPTPEQETPLRRLCSGSLAGMTSVFVTYPLEVLRVRLAFETKSDSRTSLRRVWTQIYHERPSPSASQDSSVAQGSGTSAVRPQSGITNFYRGFAPTLIGMLPYAGMSFLTHDMMTDLLRMPLFASRTVVNHQKEGRDSPTTLKSWAELLAGGTAGLVSQTAAYPLEVIRRRMQVGGVVGDGHRMTMAETAGKIAAERGWRGFFVGLTIGYIKVVPMVAVSFLVYERTKVFLGV